MIPKAPFSERIRSVSYWRHRIIEVFIAVISIYLITSFLDQKEADARAAVPASAWFEVSELFVPDHKRRSNPDMIYDRLVKVEFRGFWIAEVQLREDKGFSTECTGSGVNEYRPGEFTTGVPVTWGWFLGRPCPVSPGTYRVVVSYDMFKPGFPVKRYSTISNTFTID